MKQNWTTSTNHRGNIRDRLKIPQGRLTVLQEDDKTWTAMFGLYDSNAVLKLLDVEIIKSGIKQRNRARKIAFKHVEDKFGTIDDR